jgi:ribosomal protein S4
MSNSARPLRLDQLLSRYGYCSRSEARTWLRAGRVTVDGAPVRDVSGRVKPESVRIDGVPPFTSPPVACAATTRRKVPPSTTCSRRNGCAAIHP